MLGKGALNYDFIFSIINIFLFSFFRFFLVIIIFNLRITIIIKKNYNCFSCFLSFFLLEL